MAIGPIDVLVSTGTKGSEPRRDRTDGEFSQVLSATHDASARHETADTRGDERPAGPRERARDADRTRARDKASDQASHRDADPAAARTDESGRTAAGSQAGEAEPDAADRADTAGNGAEALANDAVPSTSARSADTSASDRTAGSTVTGAGTTAATAVIAGATGSQGRGQDAASTSAGSGGGAPTGIVSADPAAPETTATAAGTGSLRQPAAAEADPRLKPDAMAAADAGRTGRGAPAPSRADGPPIPWGTTGPADSPAGTGVSSPATGAGGGVARPVEPAAALLGRITGTGGAERSIEVDGSGVRADRGLLAQLQSHAPLSAASPTATAAAQAAEAAAAGGKAGAAPTPPALDQIAMRVHKAVGDGAGKIEMQLKPAHLGRVEVHMQVAADGHVQATIAADRPETLYLLQRDARALAQALQEAGLETDAGSLEFNLTGRGDDTPERGDLPGVPASGGIEPDGPDPADPAPAAWQHTAGSGRLDIRV